MNGKSLTTILILVVGLFLVANSLFIIKETERAVLLRFGEVVQPDIALILENIRLTVGLAATMCKSGNSNLINPGESFSRRTNGAMRASSFGEGSTESLGYSS